jgi:undecaprenyl-diphosphatase
MSSAEGALPPGHALALGLAHGPAELLPISSSAHTALLPWLAGWPYERLDSQRRKRFEVALHSGAGLALAIHMRRELRGELAGLDRRRSAAALLAIGLPALAGYALEGPVERRLGGPRSIAAGLLAGAVAMALADRGGGTRRSQDAGVRDGLALGLAQAAALMPGVSRNGATLAAARARGFARPAAQSLSWHSGLPVILGASVLQGAHLKREGLAAGERAALALGGGGAFVSTALSARLLSRRLRDGQALAPFSAYRCVLAALVLARVRAAASPAPPCVRAQ